MKKESKNEGLAKSCPDCKKTLIKSVNIVGKGSFRTRCKHCDALILVEVGQKTFITATKIKVVLLVVVIWGSWGIFTLTNLKNRFTAFVEDNNFLIIK